MALKALLFNRALLLTTFLISPQIAFAQEPVPAQNPADQPPEDEADRAMSALSVLPSSVFKDSLVELSKFAVARKY